MNDFSTNKQPGRRGEPDRINQSLFGKNVLLIGDNTAVLASLVEKLARKGANIALLCWQTPLEIAHKVQEYLQSSGQQLLFIQRAENQQFSAEALIQNVIHRWGHVDIYIDISAKKETAPVNAETIRENGQQDTRLAPQLQRTWQVLAKMAIELGNDG